jgi:uncharacterized membrane protein
MMGILFTVLSAASFGLNTASVRRGVVRGSAMQGVYVTVFIGVPLFLLAAFVTGQLASFSNITQRGYILLAIAGVLHFLWGRYCGYRALGIIGANRTAALDSLATLLAVLLAVVVLGESLDPINILGVGLVIIGPAIMIRHSVRQPSAIARSPEPPSVSSTETSASLITSTNATAVVAADPPEVTIAPAKPPARLVEGYIWALLNAAAFGISPILIRSALSGTNGLGIVGALAAYSAAGAVLACTLVLPGRVGTLAAMDKRTFWWFNLGAVTVFSAQLFRFLALSIAPASIVTPLIRMSAVFTVIFAFILNRRLETFGMHVIVGIILSVLGAVALAL